MRFGLSTDGMNPFGEMSSGHSTWPVTMHIQSSTMAMHEAEIYHDAYTYPGPKAARI